MLNLLLTCLSKYGLECNILKAKVLTTELNTDDDHSFDCALGNISVLSADETHKYLGRKFAGDLRKRARTAIDFRIQCAWIKFRELRQSLCNRHVSIRSRLRLFDAVVTPTLLYGLETVPFSSMAKQRVDTVFRKMLKLIVGWTIHEGKSWEENGRIMKDKVRRALNLYPVAFWSESVEKRRCKLKSRIMEGRAPQLTTRTVNFEPRRCQERNGTRTYRKVGRPPWRWED